MGVFVQLLNETGDEETPLQRRGMSEACVDTVDHALSVRGVCSCAHGLLVEGRNVTQELDAALGVVSEASTDRAATTDVAASTLSTPNCTLSNNASVVGGVINTTFLNGAYGIALTPDQKYAVATGYLSDSLAIINITDPTHPSIVGGLLVADLQLDAPTTVVVSPNGQYAFVGALQSNELVVVDIATDVTKPSVAGRFTARSPLGVTTFDGDFVYLSSYNNPTLTVVNVSDPTNPTGSGTISDIQACRMNEVKLYYLLSTINRAVYKHIRANGGWDNWDMVEVAKVEATDKRDLERIERTYIESLAATLNCNIPTRSAKERYAKNRTAKIEYQKRLYRKNRTAKIEYQKELYRKNRTAKIEYQRQYDQQHAKARREYQRQYYHANKAKRLEDNKQVAEKERKMRSVECECGAVVTHTNLRRHRTTRKHALRVQPQPTAPALNDGKA